MNYLENLEKLGRGILDLVFPISCIVCGADGEFLCAKCQKNLQQLEKQLCLSCHKPAPFGKTHPECLTKSTVDGSIAALDYKNPDIKNLIKIFKYNFVSDLANPLSELIVEAIDNQGLDEYFEDFTIVPVPLHQRRLNWRGFNQSALLSTKLAERLRIKIDNQLVARQKNTTPQAALKHAEERKKNIENAFNLIGDATNKKIVLVDDLVTSGSTANEIAKLLKRSNAAEVWIITAAHG